MHKYQSHKTVQAARVIGWEADRHPNGELRVTIEGSVVPFVFPAAHDFRHRFKATKEDLGYLVMYSDGYLSWSPTKAFEDGNTRLEGGAPRTFGEALTGLKFGERWARVGWNGKGIFVFLVPGSTFQVNRPPLLGIYPEGTTIDYHAHIDMKTATDEVVPWVPSQTDVLAEDWTRVD